MPRASSVQSTVYQGDRIALRAPEAPMQTVRQGKKEA